ncbi:MAG: flagellar filament capping protein FliD [Pseudomonadota bacterium]
MAISSPGIGSGLDVKAIVSQLVAAEGNPISARIDRDEADYQAKLSAFGSLKSALADFNSSLAGLKDITNFQKRSVNLSNKDVLSASADTTAVEGGYDIEVKRIAQKHKFASSATAPAATFGGAGGDALTVTVGAKTLTVDLSTAKTLADIHSAINAAAESDGVNVRASLINDGTNQTLVLTSGGYGYDNRVQLGGTIGGTAAATVLGFSTLNKLADGSPLASLNQLDAEMVVDGVTITRGSNAISDVITGVSFNLIAAKPGTLVNMGVSQNSGSIQTLVKGFVDSYNKLADVMRQMSMVDVENNKRGVLVGDATLRTVMSGLRTQISNATSGITGPYDTLASIGVTSDKTGKLTLDSAKLTKAIDADFTSVGQIFAGDNGYAARLEDYLDGYVGTKGVLDSKIDGLNTSIKGLDKQRETLQYRLDSLEKRYTRQFAGLDEIISSMQLTSSFLNQQLAILPKLTINRS